MANSMIDFMPYDQQMAELQRRQRMAQMLQDQAAQPLESQVAPGGMVVPTSPVLGLAQLLKSYIGGKAQAAVGKETAAARQRARDEFGRFIEQTSPEAAPSPDMTFSQGDTPVMAPQTTRAQMRQRLIQGLASGNPMVEQYAQTMLAQKPERNVVVDKFDPSKYTPESLAAALRADNPALLNPIAGKDEKPVVAGGMVWDAKQGKFVNIEGYAQQAAQIAAAGRAAPAPESPIAVIGPDGKPVYVSRAQAMGKQPYTATTAAQEQRDISKEQANKSASISTQQALDLAAELYADPARTTGTGFSSILNNIPGTGARDFQAKLNTFKAQTFIPMVSALKGMGALSDAEGKKLSESVGALDPAMSEDAFAKSLQQTTRTLYDKAVAAGLNVLLPDFAKINDAAPPPGFVRPRAGK